MVPFTVNIKDFTLGTGTGAIIIPQPPAGQSSSVTVPVTLTALNNYNTSTALSCTGQPAAVTCAFSPASGIPTVLGLHSTLTVTSTSAVPVGVYHLQVKAAAGTLIRLQALDVTDYGPNFTQAVAPATQNVVAGSSAAYTVTYTPLGGMTQDIAVGCGPRPAGVTCTANPPIANPGNGYQSTVTLAAAPGTTPANSNIAISGVSSALNNLTRSTNVTLSVKDFTLTTNTGTVNTNVGSNITDTILVKGLNGFTGNVALSCAIVSPPPGMGCALSNVNPAASSSGTSVTATITSNAGTTPPGSYTVQVTGTNSGQSKILPFTVNIKDFTLTPAAAAIAIPQPPTGQSSAVSVPLTLTAQNSYNTSTALSCSGQPAGVTCAFAPASLVPTGAGINSTLTITGASTAMAATFPLTVKATAGTLVRQQVITVTLWGPNFTQAVTPTTQNLVAGSSVNYTVTYTPLGGMTQDIAVSCGPLPVGVTCTPNPAIATPGVTVPLQSVVTLQTTFGTTPAANSTVTISGNSAAIGVTRSNNVTLSVKDFTVTASTATLATNVGTNVTKTILVKGVNGFTGVVGLSCAIVSPPAGMGCTLSNPSPMATSTGTSVTATLSSSAATTPAGSYAVEVTGTTGAGSHTAPFTVIIKDFALDVEPDTQTITANGGTVFADYTLTATALNGFTGSVALSCVTPLPTGVTCGFGPSHISSMAITPTLAGAPVTFRITVTGSTAPNDYHLNIRGTAGTLIRLNPVELQLQ
jgi:hypothetical protein